MPEDAAVAALRGKHPLSWYRRLHTRAVWYMTQGDERDLFRALARQEARLDALAPLVAAVERYGKAAATLDAFRRDGEIVPGQPWEFVRRLGELANAKGDAREDLLALARAAHDDAPEGGVRNG